MDFSTILASIAVALSSGGVGAALIELIRHFRSERALVSALKNDERNDAEVMHQLDWARTQLASERPDPATLAAAAEVIMEAARKLSDSERRDILGTLARGSDKSKANYLAKIIDEVTPKGNSSAAPN